MTSYKPLAGVKVLDLGVLIPSALTTAKLAAMGADVVKVERGPGGDRLRNIPPTEGGEAPWFVTTSWGKRSIALDAKDPEDFATLLKLIRASDVVVENQLAGFWKKIGVDFEALRAERPELIVCSVTGYGQTGPWAQLPAHGSNVDAMSDGLNIEWRDGKPHRGWTYSSWGNEMGAYAGAMAVAAAIVSVRSGGEGAWIDASCWDAVVESHRAEIALSAITGEVVSCRDVQLDQALYATYLTSDGETFLIGALEYKFWERFCEGVGRPDLLEHHSGDALEYGVGDDALRAELEVIFLTADIDTWSKRFVEWGCVGGPVLGIEGIMKSEHYKEREMATGGKGKWENIAQAFRWHHTGERAGADLAPPPEFDAHRDAVLSEWLG